MLLNVISIKMHAHLHSLMYVNVISEILVNSTDAHISLLHTVYDREIWGIYKGYVGKWLTCRILPQVWGLVPSSSIPCLSYIKQVDIVRIGT